MYSDYGIKHKFWTVKNEEKLIYIRRLSIKGKHMRIIFYFGCLRSILHYLDIIFFRVNFNNGETWIRIKITDNDKRSNDGEKQTRDKMRNNESACETNILFITSGADIYTDLNFVHFDKGLKA